LEAYLRMSLVVLFLLVLLLACATALLVGPKNVNLKSHSVVRGERWGDFDGFSCQVLELENPAGSTKFNALGDYGSANELGDNDVNNEDAKRHREFNMKVGKCMETLRRELPFVFFASNLDYSIFADEIVVSDGSNRMAMQKSLYTTVVKSLKLASTFSATYPAMNVRKIEFIEDCSTIQCLVDVVLPDSIRIDGTSTWDGMFYFGLDSHGLISSHTFDRKISKKTPSNLNTKSFPWLRATPKWSPELLVGVGCETNGEEFDGDRV